MRITDGMKRLLRWHNILSKLFVWDYDTFAQLREYKYGNDGSRDISYLGINMKDLITCNKNQDNYYYKNTITYW